MFILLPSVLGIVSLHPIKLETSPHPPQYWYWSLNSGFVVARQALYHLSHTSSPRTEFFFLIVKVAVKVIRTGI
jgi:hypothetical protein